MPDKTPGPPVTYSEDKVSLNHDLMEPERPYPVRVDGHWLIAVLHGGHDCVTLYAVPRPPETAS